ncbi:crAss001_48 related protein [Limosilactobacillus sp.]|uniref:crAss001_48 related protein n=1 Tax=Limosilactobacillus sp. TaxID=2773925 RepID=UPI003F081EBC
MNKQKVVIKLLEERTSLDVKRIKLKCFIKSADFNNASEHQRRMLRLQQETMDVYSKILNNRIEDLLGDLYYETH